MRDKARWLIAPALIAAALVAVVLLNSPSGFQAFSQLDPADKDATLSALRDLLDGSVDQTGIRERFPAEMLVPGDSLAVVSLWRSWEMVELRKSADRMAQHALSKIDPQAAAPQPRPIPAEQLLRVGGQGPDQAAALIQAADELERSGLKPEQLAFYRIEVELLREVKPLRSENGLLSRRALESGVSGVAWSNGETLFCALPDEAIRLELKPRSFIPRVKDGQGLRLRTDLPKGLYRFRTDAFIERRPDGAAQTIYRAGGRIDAINADQIERACLLGGDFLLRLLKPDGKFFYRYYPIKRENAAASDPTAILGRYLLHDDFDRSGYNLLRHCGTTYSLMQLYQHTKLERYREGGERALEWMIGRTRPKPGSQRGLLMFEEGESQAKLGGAGLAILALVAHAQATGDLSHREVMEGLAEGICEMQLPNGDFDNYAALDPDKPAKQRRSIYYPGEAILGLVRLHQLDNNPKWLEHARRGADFLVHERWTLLWMQMYVPPDAWLMLALEELHEVTDDPAYRDYAYLLADNMIKDQFLTRAPFPDWLGGYSTSRKLDLLIGPVTAPNVTPAGSRMEGFTAVYLLAERENDRAMMDKLYRTIEAGTTFQVSSMIRPETAYFYPDPAMAIGGFRHNSYLSKVQIDYNQHNISGLLVARQIMQRRGEK